MKLHGRGRFWKNRDTQQYLIINCIKIIVFTHQRVSHKHSFGSDVSLKSWVPPSKSLGFFLVDWLLFPAKAHKNPDTNLLNTRGVKSPLREGEINWKRKKKS